MHRPALIALIHSARLTLERNRGGKINVDAYRDITNTCHELSRQIGTAEMKQMCTKVEKMARDLYGHDLPDRDVDDMHALLDVLLSDLAVMIERLEEGFHPGANPQ